MKNHIYIFLTLFVILFPASLYAGGKVEETRFTNEVQRYYLSPSIKDGNFDMLTLDLSGVYPPKGRSFVAMAFTVYAADGTVAYIKETALAKTKVLPAITYDGTNAQGQVLPDGAYVFTITSTDDKNNESVSKPFFLVLDNTAPEIRSIKLITGNTVVPNSSEERNIKISIDGSSEILWKASAQNKAGERVSLFSRKSDKAQRPPQLWSWIGKDSNGEVLEDGAYTLIVSAQDEAGNKTELALDTRVIVSSMGALSLSAQNTIISPNDDGIMDTLPLVISGNEALLDSFVTSEILVFSVTDNTEPRNIAVIETQGVPQAFDGKDENGRMLQDGEYHIAVHLVTEENDVYLTNRMPITLDSTAPELSFSIETAPTPTPKDEPLYFGSAERNELKGSVSVRENAANISIKITHKDEIFFSSSSQGADSPIDFVVGQEGTLDGKVMEDGLYEIIVSARDEAGNVAEYPRIKVMRDTQEKSMKLSTSANNVSGRKNPLQIRAEYPQEGLKESLLTIQNAEGKTVLSESLPYHLPSYYWNARNNQNKLVEDGNYNVELTAVYYNGARITESIRDIAVDSTPPKLEVFMPNTDIVLPKGENKKTKALVIQQKSSEKDSTWRAEIRNIFDAVIAEQSFEDLRVFTWDAKNDSGEIVPDGDYFYRLVGEDATGNRTERTTSFIVDTSIYESGKILSVDGSMPKIYFPGYSDDIFALTGEKEKVLYENLLAVRSVAKLLKTHKDHAITITGHAARLLYGTRAAKEQNEVLLPLSRKRAEAIRRALIILGIEEERITMRAMGGTQPAITKPTMQTIWRNRRVEFEITQ